MRVVVIAYASGVGDAHGICVRYVMHARAYCCSEVAIVIESYYLWPLEHDVS